MGRWKNAALTVLMLVASSARAGSFRGASVSWRVPDPSAAPDTVEISITTIWDRPTTDATTADLDLGDGSAATAVSGPVTYTGTTELGHGYAVQQTTVTHAYAASGTYTLVLSGCCRHATTNNSDGTLPFRLTATVALGTGMRQSPPSLVIEPTMTDNGKPYVYIPAAFGDAQAPTAREASMAESGLAIPELPDGLGGQKPPAPVVDQASAHVEMDWSAIYSSGSTYELAFVISDARGGSTAVDFIVEVTDASSVFGSGTLFPKAPEVGGAPGAPITDYGDSLNGVTGTLANMPASATFGITASRWDLSWTPAQSDLGTSRIALIELVLPDGSHQEHGVAIYVQPQVDECTNGTADCAPTGAACWDTPWGYRCTCTAFFEGDGRTCTAFCTEDSPYQFCTGPHGKTGSLCCGDQATGNVTCTCPSGGTPPPPSPKAGGGGCTTSGAPGILLGVLALLLPRRRSR